MTSILETIKSFIPNIVLSTPTRIETVITAREAALEKKTGLDFTYFPTEEGGPPLTPKQFKSLFYRLRHTLNIPHSLSELKGEEIVLSFTDTYNLIICNNNTWKIVKTVSKK